MTHPRIDLNAPWQLAESMIQREQSGKGRYRVRARYITGKPPNYEYAEVSYWLPEDAYDSHTGPAVDFLATRQITNSRQHPSVFEGMELPREDIGT